MLQIVIQNINHLLKYKVSTFYTAPSAPPPDVEMTTRTSTSLAYEWLQVPCGNRGGPIEFVFALYDEDGNVDSDTTNDLSATFDRLVPCRIYNFTVRASNDAGNGSFVELSEEGTDSEGNETRKPEHRT